MSVNLDKSLDDIINENGKNRRGNRNQGQGRQASRSSPYARRDGGVQKRGGNRQQQQQGSQNVMFNPAAFIAAAQQQNQSSGKILVSNLDYGVTEADLRALFSQVGPIGKAVINYGANGKSMGTAEVTFRNSMHAALAVEKYNGIHLDGRRMKIEVAFNPMAAAATMMMPQMVGSPLAQKSSAPNGGNKGKRNVGGRAGGRTGGGGGSQRTGGQGGNNRRRGGNKEPQPTKESLDADLDSYMQDGEKPAAA
ncbi:hypothetical protein GGI25_001894 [Coemansia spiralis]|uniref:RRM domain-containing protein n=2 Tax=Coemansia TaxID=4863 RepID=A0A9W8G500_9FUNG|nr:hypothetical protein BX070DRAFT_234884 [Coemansia spiralis]KAJ1993328.1 hypothetical protein EDC05_002192 [Coemansia umbellata]KAJ2623524.1 hypothetical protein GGI26_002363 [Coemansia sp. RSA 1358]KAJ2678905.1 hypothetical protein GGI25_001894 [Coemansia spiralis]